jgi:hypothetical protein
MREQTRQKMGQSGLPWFFASNISGLGNPGAPK